MKLLFVFFCLLPLNLVQGSPIPLTVEKHKGVVRFFAVGNPSSLSIEGTGEGPQGEMKLVQGKDLLTLNGQLSFRPETLDTGMELRNQHMKENYLQVGKFPNAILTLSPLPIPAKFLEGKQEGSFPFSGLLHLHGVQKPVNGEVRIKSSPSTLAVNAQFQIRLQDFHIGIPSFAGITLGEMVKVEVELEADKKD